VVLIFVILKWTHQPKEMPGVGVEWCGLVRQAGQSSIESGSGDWKRQKVRLLLRDQGIPFMEIKSPYDALVAAWDALEGQ